MLIITGPLFLFGVIKGYHNPVADNYAPLKVGTLVIFLARGVDWARTQPPRNPATIPLITGLLAGCLTAGTAYYIGKKLGEGLQVR
jgi:hypothetical protein